MIFRKHYFYCGIFADIEIGIDHIRDYHLRNKKHFSQSDLTSGAGLEMRHGVCFANLNYSFLFFYIDFPTESRQSTLDHTHTHNQSPNHPITQIPPPTTLLAMPCLALLR